MTFEEDLQAGASTGNWGILDIQSALRWVRREVGAFGGDGSRVMIHGQSSGGGLVELQYVAPHSAGLFHAAISESGGLGATATAKAVNNTRLVGGALGCLGKDGSVTKACMRNVPTVNITDATYTGSWGPTVDGFTFPEDPQALLAAGRVNDASVIFGAQTNDSFLFLSRDYTLHGDSQPNNHTDGDLEHMNASSYVAALTAKAGNRTQRALELYPAAPTPSIQNVQSLGRVESDQGLCANRRRAKLLNQARPGSAFTYRFDYWYKSNRACTAVPNFHLDYLGAVHQDEVTFVMGQPNFMEAGSCCGKWGLSEGAESCAREPKCVACYDEAFGEGYAAYFDAKEFRFARTVGAYWTNFAASRDPNERDGRRAQPSVWPDIRTGGFVLDADVEGGGKAEAELYDNPAVCALWDAVAREAGARRP